MIGPPVQVVLVPYPVAGSPKEARRAKPIWPPKPKQQPWPPRSAIPAFVPPADQVDAIKRAGKAIIEQVRSQRSG